MSALGSPEVLAGASEMEGWRGGLEGREIEAGEDPALCNAEGEAGREGPMLVSRRKENWEKRARGQVRAVSSETTWAELRQAKGSHWEERKTG